VSSGSGRYRATKVGAEAYAVRLAEEAKRFTLVRSELRNGINRILKTIAWVMVPTVVLLVWSQMNLETHIGLKEALRATAAGIVAMVPEGLVLLTSVAFAVGVVRLGRRRVLVQELPAVEGLARVDVICFDKTGTLTEGRLAVESLEVLDAATTRPPPWGRWRPPTPTPTPPCRPWPRPSPPPPDGCRPPPSPSPPPASGAGPPSGARAPGCWGHRS